MARSGSSSSSLSSITNMPSISTATAGAQTTRSAPDALASAANYLKGIGWQAGDPWIEEVGGPGEMDWSQADVTIKKPRLLSGAGSLVISAPQRQGAQADETPTSLLLPMGWDALAFDHLSEFRRLSRMEPVARRPRPRRPIPNASCRGVGAEPARGVEPLPIAQAEQVQQLLAKRGYDVLYPPRRGWALRPAARSGRCRRKTACPPTGHPTMELLAALTGAGGRGGLLASYAWWSRARTRRPARGRCRYTGELHRPAILERLTMACSSIYGAPDSRVAITDRHLYLLSIALISRSLVSNTTNSNSSTMSCKRSSVSPCGARSAWEGMQVYRDAD